MHLASLILLATGLVGRSLCVIEEKPAIYDLQFGNKLEEGKKFFLVCLLSNGDPDAAFDWFLNGRKVIPNENVYVKQDEESSILNVRQMTLELAGEFECRASNRFGRDSRSISVRLEGECDTELVQNHPGLFFFQKKKN